MLNLDANSLFNDVGYYAKMNLTQNDQTQLEQVGKEHKFVSKWRRLKVKPELPALERKIRRC